MFLKKREVEYTGNGEFIEFIEMINEAEIHLENLSHQTIIIEHHKCIKGSLLLEEEQGIIAKLLNAVSGFFGKVFGWVSKFFSNASGKAESLGATIKKAVSVAAANPVAAVTALATTLGGAKLMIDGGKEMLMNRDIVFKRLKDIEVFQTKKMNDLLSNLKSKNWDYLKNFKNDEITSSVKVPEDMSDKINEAYRNYIYSGDPSKVSTPFEVTKDMAKEFLEVAKKSWVVGDKTSGIRTSDGGALRSSIQKVQTQLDEIIKSNADANKKEIIDGIQKIVASIRVTIKSYSYFSNQQISIMQNVGNVLTNAFKTLTGGTFDDSHSSDKEVSK